MKTTSYEIPFPQLLTSPLRITHVLPPNFNKGGISTTSNSKVPPEEFTKKTQTQSSP